MAALNYHAILEAITAMLKASATTNSAQILIEQDPVFGLSDNPAAIVSVLNSRSPDTQGQSLSAGKRTRFNVSISVWIVGFSQESFEKASNIRDDLLAEVELVLMADRTLGGTVAMSWLSGGVFQSVRAPDQNVFCSMAEVSVTAQASAINS